MIGDILQPTHLLFVLVVALLVLGPKRLPEAGRALGNGIRDFRMAISGEEHNHGAINQAMSATPAAPPAAAPSPPPAEPTVTPPAPEPTLSAPQAAEPALSAPQPAEPAVSEADPVPNSETTEPAQPVA
jgi:sec-independent protein translocase protein TatA